MKTEILRKKSFQIFFHGGKEDFEEYLLNLEYAELSFLILNNFRQRGINHAVGRR
jgi:hypothetical protein